MVADHRRKRCFAGPGGRNVSDADLISYHPDKYRLLISQNLANRSGLLPFHSRPLGLLGLRKFLTVGRLRSHGHAEDAEIRFHPARDAGKAQCGGAQRRLSRDLSGIRRAKGRRTVRAVQPVRRALLPKPLPAAQQHPGLVAPDRGRPAQGSLSGQPGDQHLPRDLRPHLSAGPAVRRQLRHRTIRPRHRHHRRGREIHHRHRLAGRLGRWPCPVPGTRRKHRHRRCRSGRSGGGGFAAQDGVPGHHL